MDSDGQAAAGYFKSLEDSPPLLEIPIDFPRTDSVDPPQFHTATATDLPDSLDRFSLLAGFATLLARYSRSEELVIGIPDEANDFLALRLEGIGSSDGWAQTFSGLVETAQQLYDQAVSAAVPFSQLVKKKGADSASSQIHPLFQTLFVVRGQVLGDDLGTAFSTSFGPVDVVLSMVNGQLQLHGRTALFVEASVQRMMEVHRRQL